MMYYVGIVLGGFVRYNVLYVCMCGRDVGSTSTGESRGGDCNG